MAGAEVHFNSLAVRQAATSCANRQRTLGEGVGNIVESLTDVAAVLQQAGEADKVDELREVVKQLLATRHEVLLHASALDEVHGSYVMGPQATDFETELGRRAGELAAEQRYNPVADEAYRAFEDAAAPDQGGADEEQIDEDIAIEGGGAQLAPNERCPITGKALLELAEPVADSRGFVYEKVGIVQWLRQQGGRGKCPVAGTSHFITSAELKPAKRVVKAQQRARRGGGGGAGRATQGEDVLDVE